MSRSPDGDGSDPSRRRLLQGAAVAAGGLFVGACAHAEGPRAATEPSPVAGGPPARPPARPPAPTGAGAPVTPAAPGGPDLAGGLSVRGPRLVRDGRPFFVTGFNYWAGPTLARAGNTAGWDQVRRDLDGLQAIGVNTVRVMAATEGPDSEPFRIVPTIQPALGQYDPAGVAGVVRFADELRRRGLYGIFTMNNFWPWSGGFAQYVAWTGAAPIPYPPPAPDGSWDRFAVYAASFYKNARAVDGYHAYLRFIVPRLNDNPAVIWELANEPRGMRIGRAFHDWIDATAKLIKTLAPAQLVTTGSEGETNSPFYAGMDLIKDHASPAIDFACFHMWAANWGWVRKGSLARDYPRAVERAQRYMSDHARRAAKLGKPVLLEEFGFPRDGDSDAPDAPTTLRDRYFAEVYAHVASLIPTTPLAGIMPWAFAGDARPPRPGQLWRPGDPFIGDPPHEPQGWYSVYDRDAGTLAVSKEWSARIASLGPTAT